MAGISNELLERLQPMQNQIWQTVSNTVSDAAGQDITIANPLAVAAKTADLYAEMSSPMMVIQFAFASQPEAAQVFLIPQDTVLGLAEIVTGTPVTEPDENIVAELRTTLEALVQGVCLSVGNIHNDTIVATGLTIRYQIFAFPPNLQRASQIVRTQLAVNGEDLNGSIIWLMDLETAGIVLGSSEEFEESTPFPTISGASSAGGGRNQMMDEPTSLELLLDVPLEMSVELGRVKMLVREVLDLTNGSILEIDKSAGEPVDVLVNGRIMARGEVVVIEDNFGVRITEIINPNLKFGREAA
jgi:flagellar motor switch protein FliN/FliY